MTSTQRLNIYLNNLMEKAEEQGKLLDEIETREKNTRKRYLDWKNENYLIEKKYRSFFRKNESLKEKLLTLIEENELDIQYAQEEKSKNKKGNKQ